MKTAEKDNPQAIRELADQILDEYPRLWVKHFDNEERYLFIPYADRSEKIQQMCDQLTLEHRQFDSYIQQMKQGNFSVLYDFGKLLQSHTRMEERELFPLISDALSEDELDGIYQGIAK